MSEQNHTGQAEAIAELTFDLLEQCQFKIEQIARTLNLTIAEFKTLRAFRDDCMISAGDLARRLHLSSSRLTRILAGLVSKGLVSREVSGSDRRVLEIALTTRGKNLREELEKTYVRTHQDILDFLPPEAAESVLVAMARLKDAMVEWAKD